MNAPAATPTPSAVERRGLGLDAGGTQTRWAVADASGTLLAEGAVAPISGLQLASAEGRSAIAAALQAVAAAAGPVQAVVAGITGFDAQQQPALCALAAQALGVPAGQVQACNDIELACQAAFAPGGGHVVYAGTGAIAAHIDAQGRLHRAGGRGVVIDDAGGGHWIAREALRHLWRLEDEAPGSAAATPLGQAVFATVGGSDWAHTRAWVYGATRGELGTLALAVARTAERDLAAQAILRAAGQELARLARALIRRQGPRPVALAGRVFELHPLIASTLQAECAALLPPPCPVLRLTLPAHHAAARIAAGAPPRPGG